MQTAPFKPRKSWALIGPNNKIIHIADNRRMLKLLLRKGDRIERCETGPVSPSNADVLARGESATSTTPKPQ